MKINNLFVLLFSINTISFSADSGTCNGVCPECAYIIPSLKAASLEIKERYEKMEKAISKRYNEEIIPLEKDFAKLEKEIMKEALKVQLVEAKILFHEKEINYQLQNIKGIESTRTSAIYERELMILNNKKQEKKGARRDK